jgi:peroxiredoxin
MAIIAIVVVVLLGLGGFVFRRTRSHLAPGRKAPDFTAQAAMGGEVQIFRLRDALAKGPVVLYFFPKSFTSGCTAEAHAFSAAIPKFNEFGATVIGISGDDIETQKKFSTLECQSAFLVASDPGLTIGKQYAVGLAPNTPNRTSYVIAPDGTIVEAFSAMFQPNEHAVKTLAAVQGLSARASG